MLMRSLDAGAGIWRTPKPAARILLVGCRADRAADALEHEPHFGVLRSRLVASCLVGLPDAAQAAIQRGHLCDLARSVRYSAIVGGVAGSGSSRCSPHQPRKP